MKTFFAYCVLLFGWLITCPAQTAIPAHLLNKTWEASWIAPPDISLKAYGVYHFRKNFSLDTKPAAFNIHITADNRYHLYVNGKSVVLGPQRSDVAHWRYETVDIAPYLEKGENVLAAWVWNQGENAAWAQLSYQTGLLVQGNSPAESVVNTNASWKVMENFAYSPVATTAHITGPFDQIFAQRYPWGWERLDFNDTRWLPARETEKAVPFEAAEKSERRLLPRNIPLLEETSQRFSGIRSMKGLPQSDQFLTGKGNLEVHPWANVTILMDQGVLTTAYPELVVSGGKGCKITVTYAEALIGDKDSLKGNRNEVQNKHITGDYDIFLPDSGEKRMFRPLWYRPFRYVELKIENHQEPLSIHDFYSRFSAYPFRENAVFNSSDSSLDTIWQVGWRTARLCAYETYMDCPYYEQLQYVGDTRIQALISLYVSGDDRLMKNAISQFYDSRIPEGLTRSRYPGHLDQVIPPFSLFWISMIHDYWMHRKDEAFVKSFVPGMREVLQWHEKQINKNNMLGVMPYWHFVDWPEEWPWKGRDEISGVPAGALEGNSSILTLQYVYTLHRASQLFAALGFSAEAKKYAGLASKLNAAAYRLCWDESKQMLADTPDKKEFSQHANVMAVLADAVPVKTQASLLQRIAADTSLIQCTIYYRFYMNQAFKKAGLGNEYVSMLTPWHNMINMGLTTFAERPEPTRSDCHAWSASPNYDFLATVCGIEPAVPGFEQVKITPHLGSLSWVEGTVPHPNGPIRVKLVKEGKHLVGEVNLPGKLSGEFRWQGKVIKLREGAQKIEVAL